MTRDGIEIVSTITVYFRLDSTPGEGNTQFGYRPSSVEKAILGQNIDLNYPIDAANRNRRWDWLPVRLAADVWRELLGKYTLDELFQQKINQTSTMTAMLKVIRTRLMEAQAPTLNDFGMESGNLEESREFKLLRKRGIHVTRLEIYNLQMPDEVENQLVQRWKTTWLERARKDRLLVDQQRDLVIRKGQEDAYIRVAEGASQTFKTLAPDEKFTGKELLKRLIRGNQDLCQQDSALHSLTVNEINQLQELLDWVEKQPEL